MFILPPYFPTISTVAQSGVAYIVQSYEGFVWGVGTGTAWPVVISCVGTPRTSTLRQILQSYGYIPYVVNGCVEVSAFSDVSKMLRDLTTTGTLIFAPTKEYMGPNLPNTVDWGRIDDLSLELVGLRADYASPDISFPVVLTTDMIRWIEDTVVSYYVKKEFVQ